MNNGTFEWSQEQVEAYARSFRAGDAVWCNGEWVKVFHLNESCALLTETSNPYVIRDNGDNVVTRGFYYEVTPFQVTTLADYELQGDEKMVWLGPTDRYRTFGKVYMACNYFDAWGKWFIAYSRDNDWELVKPKVGNPWGVIPRYENVKVESE